MMKSTFVSVKALLLMILLVLFVNAGCDNNADKVSGAWHSVSVRNPSPFFKNVLTDYKEGAISLVLYPDNKFIWADSFQNTRLKGTYEVKGKDIVLSLDGEDEILKVKYSIKRQKLVIKTDDFFTFTFVRDGKQ